MLITKTISETNAEVLKLREAGKKIGFVPTMGALHQGHISLLEQSRIENDATVCSIFVNPIQFNNPDDLEKYPRTEYEDLKMLKDAGCNMVFMPSPTEMYPEENKIIFDFGHLDKVMEGQFRPGHFNGVAVVVKKLFDIVQPHRAYFGEKDFQQLTIIKALVKMLQIPVEIVPCPTLREPSGLAMSSRNERLSTKDRETASVIYKTMRLAREKVPLMLPQACERWVIDEINSTTGLDVEYFKLVDAQTLLPVHEWNTGLPVRGCVAAYIGGVRLIDNILFF